MELSELTSDRDIENFIGEKWNNARGRWQDAQATEFYDKCFYPLVLKIEDMGKDARDVMRIGDAVRAKVDEIMR